MTRGRVEECFPLNLVALTDPSRSTWVLPSKDDWLSAREPSKFRMLVRRNDNQLRITLWIARSKYVLVRQSVTIDPRRRGGYREFLVCPRCGWRVRQLFLPMGGHMFLCRTCH